MLEKDSSVGSISLAKYTVLLLNLVEVKGQQELLESDEEWEEEVEWNGELKVEEWTPTSCMDEMRQTRGHLESRDVVCNE